MADAGFFRGTTAEQDNRFADKQKKYMKSLKSPEILSTKIDIDKIDLDAHKSWIDEKIKVILEKDDEILSSLIFNHLSDKNLDGTSLQLTISGFATEDKIYTFMEQLWTKLIDIQTNANGRKSRSKTPQRSKSASKSRSPSRSRSRSHSKSKSRSKSRSRSRSKSGSKSRSKSWSKSKSRSRSRSRSKSKSRSRSRSRSRSGSLTRSRLRSRSRSPRRLDVPRGNSFRGYFPRRRGGPMRWRSPWNRRRSPSPLSPRSRRRSPSPRIRRRSPSPRSRRRSPSLDSPRYRRRSPSPVSPRPYNSGRNYVRNRFMPHGDMDRNIDRNIDRIGTRVPIGGQLVSEHRNFDLAIPRRSPYSGPSKHPLITVPVDLDRSLSPPSHSSKKKSKKHKSRSSGKDKKHKHKHKSRSKSKKSKKSKKSRR